MNIIIDTNLWISFAIGKNLSVMRILFNHPQIRIYVCEELLKEFALVAARLKIRKYLTHDDVRDTYTLMERCCLHATTSRKATSPVRDKKDLYLLSLAETIPADFILTGDKDLLSLQSHGQTRILTYRDFIAIIGKD